MNNLYNLPNWLNAFAAISAAVVTFLAWRVQKSISSREARRIVLDIYEGFFTREECRRIIREIEKQKQVNKYYKFWNDLKYDPPPGELDETDLDEYLGYFEILGGLVRRKAVFFEENIRAAFF